MKEAIAIGGRLLGPEEIEKHAAAAETARQMLEALRLEDIRSLRYDFSREEIQLLRGAIVGLADLRDWLQETLREYESWGKSLTGK